ncbi:MAG: 50S ribosomal protein L9 [Pseudomonadota bacterium]
MQVILLERVEKLGSIGDEVSVKDGFARNFLLPRKKALRATDANRAVFEARREVIESENAEARQKAENLSTSIADKTFVVIRSASDMGQLYGSVSTRDIAEIASTKKLKLDKAMVLLNAPIKELGIVPVRVKLHPEVIVDIRINVARSEEEAEAQERGENVLAKQEEAIENVVGTGDFDEFGDAPRGDGDAAPEAKGDDTPAEEEKTEG